jgi:REP element-mobilizing transposase RayT
MPFARHPLVFLTVCAAGRARLLAHQRVHLALQEVWKQSAERNGWFVGRYVIMPDHVHLFAMPAQTAWPLHRWVALWKSTVARRMVAAGLGAAPIWQRDYFDRFLRSADSYSAKWDYVKNNPVRAGLADDADAWPFQGVIHDLAF